VPWSSRAILHGLIDDVQGMRGVRGSVTMDANDPEQSGVQLADQLREEGATETQEGLRRESHAAWGQP
jgi:hypothetical protein